MCNLQFDILLGLLLDLQKQNRRIIKRLKTMSEQLDTLTAQVTAIETVDQSVIALLGGLKTQLDAAIASADPPAALQALSDRLATQAQALSDAVLANTPGEPVIPATPVDGA